ncbi:potassium channel subfamily K member 10 [Nephila pilipes]|uniref:Potassium channel subfamily K member 10 n=1 Tax=Nephila pilipes TaxID=299642 RepID=A0A8X6TFH8_NEPPI|nr:potassium channel subfamily K member 10 [Nephila pilipes]
MDSGKIEAVEILRKENFEDDDIFFTFDAKKYHDKEVTWGKIYGERFLFSIVLLATIGYGNVRLITPSGQLLFLVYGLIGIPLNLTLIRLMASQHRSGLRLFVRKTEEMTNSNILIFMSIVVYFILFATIFFYIPAAYFSGVESWYYHESLYYCFVTLATVGFGDYVSGRFFYGL